MDHKNEQPNYELIIVARAVFVQSDHSSLYERDLIEKSQPLREMRHMCFYTMSVDI